MLYGSHNYIDLHTIPDLFWKAMSSQIQCSKKETFRPRRGPEFPPYDQKSNFLGSSVFLFELPKKNCPTLIRKKYFACFGVESFFF